MIIYVHLIALTVLYFILAYKMRSLYKQTLELQSLVYDCHNYGSEIRDLGSCMTSLEARISAVEKALPKKKEKKE